MRASATGQPQTSFGSDKPCCPRQKADQIGGSSRIRPKRPLAASKIKKTTNSSFTRTAARPPRPKKPRYAATRARTKKVTDHPNTSNPTLPLRPLTCEASLSSGHPHSHVVLAAQDGFRGSENSGKGHGKERLVLGHLRQKLERGVLTFRGRNPGFRNMNGGGLYPWGSQFHDDRGGHGSDDQDDRRQSSGHRRAGARQEGEVERISGKRDGDPNQG